MMLLTGIAITTISLLVIVEIFECIRGGRPETERPIAKHISMARGLS